MTLIDSPDVQVDDAGQPAPWLADLEAALLEFTAVAEALEKAAAERGP